MGEDNRQINAKDVYIKVQPPGSNDGEVTQLKEQVGDETHLQVSRLENELAYQKEINSRNNNNKPAPKNHVDITHVQDKEKELESLCKKLYMHIDIEYSKKIEIPDHLKYMFTPVHETVEGLKDYLGNTYPYVGDTIDGIPHGYGKMTNSLWTYEGTFMNGMMHGRFKYTWNNNSRTGDQQYMYNQPHGYQIEICNDHVAYHVYNHGDGLEWKSVMDDHTDYRYDDESSREFYQLTYYHDGSKIEVLENILGNKITYIRE